MNRKSLSIPFVAIALGLAWAMRGHFGHEWGASWAGAIGVLAVLLVSKRKDWAQKAPALTVLGAMGWGAGGMMSYGMVVGYCRSLSFPNALYGYTMLALIGGLYGFLGGGLFGLGLESEEKHRPDWPRLITEMFAGGFLTWGLLIYQMNWLMTPPRSELWAAILGAALALIWYLARNRFFRALRVAAYSALGAGFGFAFGNFLQTLGSTSGLSYNWWNVMEFTLGFFGGLGMAWAVLTREWPQTAPASKTGNWVAAVIVFLFIPLVNIANGMEKSDFIKMAERLHINGAETFANHQMIFALLSLVIFAVLFWYILKKCHYGTGRSLSCGVPALFFLLTLEYNLFSYIKLATFSRSFSFGNSDTLYIFILIFLFFFWYFLLQKKETPVKDNDKPETWKRWGIILGLLLISLVIITLISVHSHGPLPGAHNRF